MDLRHGQPSPSDTKWLGSTDLPDTQAPRQSIFLPRRTSHTARIRLRSAKDAVDPTGAFSPLLPPRLLGAATK